jgi:deoxyribonuclease V
VRAQEELAALTPPGWRPAGPRPLVAACFVCFRDEAAWAAAVLMRGDRRQAGSAVVRGVAAAPYEPGLLALREGPLLEAALRALPEAPEVVMANASGRDHPRGAGLALHLGAVLGLPSVGVTDRPLLGLTIGGSEVAREVTTRAGARPVVVHSGWRTDLDTAQSVVLGSTRRARTPEPLRRARRAARRARAEPEG